MQSFPRWVHHKEHKDKLVGSKEELASLGEGWGDDSCVWRQHLLEEDKAIEAKDEKAVEPELPQGQAEEPKQKGKKGRK